jgi:hypothetical protein
MDFRSLLHNRRVQLGALGAGGAAGLVVYLRRRRAAGAGAATATTETTGAGAGATGPYTGGGFPDTTGTDVASWLGQYTGNLDQELAQFTQQQQDIQTTLNNLASNEGHTPGGVTTPPGHPPVPNPVGHPTAPPPANQPQYVTVAKWIGAGSPWNSTLSGIAGHEHETLKQIERLNPQVHNPNVIITGQKIRVR